ncbi:MAG: universal stress protein [Bacillota bacterium]
MSCEKSERRKILLATDGSETSKKAAAFAAGLIEGVSDLVITVITVITVPKSYYSRRLYWAAKERPSEAEEIKKLFLEEAQRILQETTGILSRRGIKTNTVVREGDPAEEIVKCAQEIGANHIVMGTRGMGNVMEFFLGSVARKVVHLSAVPVSLVK